MRLPRMTTRRGMIAVAVSAVLMAAGLGPRWQTCSEEISYHASEERLLLHASDGMDRSASSRQGNAAEMLVSMVLSRGFRERAAQHARSRRRWEYARWMPWLTLPPIEPRRDRHGH
jgi:hypothetical protein